MSARKVAYLSIFCIITTYAWVALLIYDIAVRGPVDTYAQAKIAFRRTDWLFYATYLNAGLLTLAAAALMSGLFRLFRPLYPLATSIAHTFVPAYALLNLVCYLSQVSILPALSRMYEQSPGTIDLLGTLLLQSWSGSALTALNLLAYAILAIPSIIYGWALLRYGKLAASAGWLLILNGLACILGFAGLVVQNAALSTGAMIGGFLYAVALIPLSIWLWRSPNIAPQSHA